MTGLKCFLCEYIHAHAQWNITQQLKKIVFCSNIDLEIIILSEVSQEIQILYDTHVKSKK